MELLKIIIKSNVINETGYEPVIILAKYIERFLYVKRDIYNFAFIYVGD